MMNLYAWFKKLPGYSFIIFWVCCLIGYNNCAAQNVPVRENSEDIYEHWFQALDDFKQQSTVSKQDFEVFSRFSFKAIDSLRGNFLIKIGNGEVTLNNVKAVEGILVKKLTLLYKRYETIKQEYPSSVNEYIVADKPGYLNATCNSSCDNIDFETGNLSGWNAYYAYNNSSTTSTIISGLTGGAAGPVTRAANDSYTSTPGTYNPQLGPNPSPDYQVYITSGSRGDALVPSVPVVSPFGGHYSVMIGDSTEVNYGVAILSQTFLVGPSNENFTYQYAVFLANPNHNYYQQPFFKIAVIDQANDTIPFCGQYSVVSGNGTQQFNRISYFETYPNNTYDTFSVYYKNWTIVNVPLKHYLGQCVTVVFEVGDCALGGHFGYAYVDASCSPLEIVSSSEVFCGQDNITLTGPAGEGEYKWTGPANGLISSDTLRNVSIDSAGTYTLVVTPFTGATCNDTLTISIGKKAGPPPHPKFKADTVCVGMATDFSNYSNPLNGGSFYWDFYNNGSYQDSTTNASWIYNSPGIYTVKLHESVDGCGTDTVINVIVDSAITTDFSADTVCVGDTTSFNSTTTGARSYYWNFGDPNSGAYNSSTLANPIHAYRSPGSYTVSLLGKKVGSCIDTVKHSVIVLALPAITLSGIDSICSGSSTVLKAGGGSIYQWSTGATTASITISPTAKTTYTVSVSNGKCSKDTSITLNLKPVLSGTLSGEGTVCYDDTINLYATGGGTYLWSTGATTSSITVPVTSLSEKTYSVIISDSGSCIALDKSITIDAVTGFACCDTTIYSGDSIILSGKGGTHYYWEPSTGLSCDTCPNIIVSPTVTTTYTLITIDANGCKATYLDKIIVDIPCRDFYVPNVFTPNGDGVNDTYLIKVEFMNYYEIWIFNRWGRQVFHSTNPDAPWDGTINGSPASDGVYYYLLRAACDNGTKFDKNGFLQLIR